MKQITCKLNKKGDGKKILSLGDASVKDLHCKTASTIVARYYKGIAGDGDNMVIEVDDSNVDESITDDLPYRIRKLTPRETYRLMGFKDADFDKVNGKLSATQLYKTAGNSIVRPVLMAIFSQMGIKGVKKWNDMTQAERYELIDKGMVFPTGGENEEGETDGDV